MSGFRWPTGPMLRRARQAGWNKELLALEAADLSGMGVDLRTLGFEAAELDQLLWIGAPDPREEAIPEPPAVPVSQQGDLWILGRHRFLHDSTTDPAAVTRLLGGVRPHLMATDSPYGVTYDPAWRARAGAGATKRTGKVLNDDRADWREAWALFPVKSPMSGTGRSMPPPSPIAWRPAASPSAARSSGRRSGWCSRAATTIWQHELCWYGVREKGKGPWNGDRKQTMLWQIPSRDSDATMVHGTQKLVRLIHNAAEAGGVHAAANAQQQRAGAAGLRAVLGIRNLDHRRRACERSACRWSSTRATSTWRWSAGKPLPERRPPSTATAAAWSRFELVPVKPSRFPPFRRHPRGIHSESEMFPPYRRHHARSTAPVLRLRNKA